MRVQQNRKIAGGICAAVLAISSAVLIYGAFFRESTVPLPQTTVKTQSPNSPSSETKEIPLKQTDTPTARSRRLMIEQQLRLRDITDERVLQAMLNVPRHRFVPPELRHLAYDDSPLPIGREQTISQPYIVALMTQLVDPQDDDRVLDVGTGSGYQAAVLGELARKVYSIEILCPLAEAARERLKGLGYQNIEVSCGDGYRGWEAHAPFDVIVVAAAPEQVPQPLIDQLAPGGRLVIPVGDFNGQTLLLIEKAENGTLTRRNIIPVQFVPMTGEVLDGPGK